MKAKELARKMEENADEDGRLDADTANAFMLYLDDGEDGFEKLNAELEKLGVEIELQPDFTEEELDARLRAAERNAKLFSKKDRRDEAPQEVDIDPIGRGLLG